MRLTKLLVAASFLCSLAGAANADLILVGGNPPVAVSTVAASFVNLGAQGFGAAPRILTLQAPGNNTVETGSSTPIPVPNSTTGDATNKSSTPTLATLGWTTGSQVGIGFNTNQTGGGGVGVGLTMQSLTLTIYNGTTVVGTFNLASSLTPLTFTAQDLALQQGNGNAVFDFGLNAAEQAQFDSIITQPGSSGFFAGLASQLGCPAGAPASCLAAVDGADSFLGFVQVPAPVVGAGLPGLLMACGGLLALARRRRQSLA